MDNNLYATVLENTGREYVLKGVEYTEYLCAVTWFKMPVLVPNCKDLQLFEDISIEVVLLHNLDNDKHSKNLGLVIGKWEHLPVDADRFPEIYLNLRLKAVILKNENTVIKESANKGVKYKYFMFTVYIMNGEGVLFNMLAVARGDKCTKIIKEMKNKSSIIGLFGLQPMKHEPGYELKLINVEE